MTAHTRTTFLGLFLCLTACSSSDAPTTQLLVSVDAEAALRERLTRLDVAVYASDDDGTHPLTDPQQFELGNGERGKAQLPLSFGIAKGAHDEIEIVFRAFDSSDAEEPLVEHKQLAEFESGLTRQIDVVLSLEDKTLDAGPTSPNKPSQTPTRPAKDASPEPEPEPEPDASIKTPDAGPLDAGPADAGPPDAGPPDDEDAGPPSVCDSNNTCEGSGYPCTLTSAGGYVCLGQFADWPMPDPSPASKFKPSYDTETKPGIVIDRVTGLEWQRIVPSTYPGCSGNERESGDTCTWEEALAYCPELSLDGSGWRLPSKIELESIIGDTRNVPAIDVVAFPNESAALGSWTSSPAVGLLEGWSWVVSVGFGMTVADVPTIANKVRCVRGIPAVSGAPSDRYKTSTDGTTVTDTRTQLVWQSDFGDVDTLEAAQAYCAELGAGWRLPGHKELLTLIDPARQEPATASVFRRIPIGGMFWTTSPFPMLDTPQTYVVDFSGGMTGGDVILRNAQDTVRFTFHARCVR